MNNRNSSQGPTFDCSVYEVQRFVAFLIWKRYFWSERKSNEDRNMDDICLNLLHKALDEKQKFNNAHHSIIGTTPIFERNDTITLHFNDFESKVVWDYARKQIASYVPAISNGVQQMDIKTFDRLNENIKIAVWKMENVGVFDNEPEFLGFTHVYNQLLGLLYESNSIKIWYRDPEMLMFKEKTDKVPQMWVPTEFMRELELFERSTGIVLYSWNEAEKVSITELEKKSILVSAYYLNNSLENRYDEEKKMHIVAGDEPESSRYPINICRYAIMFSEQSNKGNSVYINKTALGFVDKVISCIKLTPQYEEVVKKVVEDTNFVKMKNFYDTRLVELQSTNLLEVKDFITDLPEIIDLYKMFCLLSCSAFKRQAFIMLVAFNEIFEALDGLNLHDAKNMLDLPIEEFCETDWMVNLGKLFHHENCKTLADVYNALVYAFHETTMTYDILRQGLFETDKHTFAPVPDVKKISLELHDKLTALSKISGLGKTYTDKKVAEEKPEADDHFSPEDDSCGHHCHLCAARKKCPEYNGRNCEACALRPICRTYLEENNVVPHVRRIVIIGRK